MSPKVRSAHIAATAADEGGFPTEGLREVAFLGRSNVGKSSLLNRLVVRRQLARTSSTPGKTRLIHFYHVDRGREPLLFVDLPGYGWARVSKEERKRWQKLVEGYLADRGPLRVAVLLQDLRRDASDDEHLLLEWLAERRVPSLVALTKTDKLKPMRRGKRVKELAAMFSMPGERVIATSSQTGLGIDLLWRAIDRDLASEALSETDR